MKISTDEAENLLDSGVPFLDVRTVEEFQDGHPPGAVNIPYLHADPSGQRVLNPDFLAVVQARFEKSDKLIVACKAGGRSANAVALLEGAGFTDLLDMAAGWSGSKDAFGRAVPGWQAEGRASSTEASDQEDYQALLAASKK